MANESLEVLIDIRNNLNVMAFFFVIGCILWGLNSIAKLAKHIDSIIKDYWVNVAIDLYAKQDLDALFQHCEDKLKKIPNDPYAHWWLGRCYGAKKDLAKCREHLNLAIDTYPTWEEEAEQHIRRFEGSV